MTIVLFVFLGNAVHKSISVSPFRDHDLVIERANNDIKVGMALLSYGDGSRHNATVSAGQQNPYQGAIQLHERYARKWGYPLWIGRDGFLIGPQGKNQTALYTKQALVHSIISNELRKPASERLEWVFFFDADTVIMNDNVPLDTFTVLPEGAFGDDRLMLCAIDQWKSFNAGVFGARVRGDTLKYLSAVIAAHVFHPERQYGNGEQTSMVYAAKLPAFEDRVSVVPSHWFNADSFHLLDKQHYGNTAEIYRFGDFMIHFMAEHKVGFSDMVTAALQGHNSTIAPPLADTRYMKGEDTVQAWWTREAAKTHEERAKHMQLIPAY